MSSRTNYLDIIQTYSQRLTTERSSDSLTWYFMGEALSSMPASLNKRSIEVVKENLPNHVPTTWEAIQAEAEEELAKPVGQRKRSRAMCLILVAKVPKGQKVAVINPSIGFYTVIKDGMY